jgi:hypothetical protein
MNSHIRISFLIYFSAIVLTCITCRKREISGHVLDVYTGKGVSDLVLNLTQFDTWSASAKHDDSWITTTGANGEFDINYHGHRAGKYEYTLRLYYDNAIDKTLETERVYLQMTDGQAINWKGGENITVNAAPAARVEINTSISPTMNIESITYSWLAMGYESKMMEWSGIGNTFIERMPSNGHATLKLYITSNGTVKTRIDTITAEPFKVTKYHLVL